MKDISKLVLKHVNGHIPVEYQNHDAQEREAAVRAAFLKEVLGIEGEYSQKEFRRKFRANETRVYEVIEEILGDTVKGTDSNSFFNQFVSRHDLDAGDTTEWFVEGRNALIVSEMGPNFSMKRQRVEAGHAFQVLPRTYGISVYEQVERLASGRSTFEKFIELVREAVALKLEELAHTALAKSLANLPSNFVASGSYDESAILDVISKVESANGETPMLVGTRAAIAKLQNRSVLSENQKDEKARRGYSEYWNGVRCLTVDNFVKTGTFQEVLPNDVIYVMSGADRPIKLVTEGGEVIKSLSGTDTQDNTMSLTLTFKAGVACIHSDCLGKIVIV